MAQNAFDELVDAMLADPSLLPEWQPARAKPVDSQKILDGIAGKSEAMTAKLMGDVSKIFGLEAKR